MEKNAPSREVEQAEGIVAKAQKNKKALYTALIVAAVVVLGALAYILIAQSGSRNADELVAKADNAQNDSIAIALYTEAAKAGYKSGNRASAELGIRYYQSGKYAEALKALDDADLDDNIAAAGVETLKGDCYVNLDNLDEALDCYEDAISEADENPEIVPFVLIKMANIYRAQGKFEKEAKAYETIIKDYPEYVQSTRTDIKKYYERALASK